MNEIVMYQDANGNCPMEEFIRELDEEAKTNKRAQVALDRVDRYIARLKHGGTRCGGKMVKHIKDAIWELRPGDYRVLFFGWSGGRFVLLHSFRKTTKKTPPAEIEKAERELKDWIARNGR